MLTQGLRRVVPYERDHPLLHSQPGELFFQVEHHLVITGAAGTPLGTASTGVHRCEEQAPGCADTAPKRPEGLGEDGGTDLGPRRVTPHILCLPSATPDGRRQSQRGSSTSQPQGTLQCQVKRHGTADSVTPHPTGDKLTAPLTAPRLGDILTSSSLPFCASPPLREHPPGCI